MKNLNEQDLEDLLIGSAILGTGGGGSLDKASETVKKDLEDGKEFKVAKLDELDDSDLIGSPYFCGSVSSDSESESKYLDTDSTKNAVKILEEYFEEEFKGLITTEIGAGNIGVALSTAADLGIPLVDGDPAGRSVPELQHTTFYVDDVGIDPIGASNGSNNILIKTVENDFVAEDIVRSIAVSFGGTVGVCDHPRDVSDLRNVLISNSVEKALKIGRKRREAIEDGSDPVESILDSDDYKIFEGEVVDYQWEEKDGFTVGNVVIEDGDDELRVWFKNEFLLSWLNGEPYVTSPDLITLVRSEDAYPLLNPDIEEAEKVSVLGFVADEKWRTSKGLDVLGPSYFKEGLEYTPLEDLM